MTLDGRPLPSGDPPAERSVPAEVSLSLTEQQVELLERVRAEFHPDLSINELILRLVKEFLKSQGKV